MPSAYDCADDGYDRYKVSLAIIFYKSHFLFNRSGFLSGFLRSGISQNPLKTRSYKEEVGFLSGLSKVRFVENYGLTS